MLSDMSGFKALSRAQWAATAPCLWGGPSSKGPVRPRLPLPPQDNGESIMSDEHANSPHRFMETDHQLPLDNSTIQSQGEILSHLATHSVSSSPYSHDIMESFTNQHHSAHLFGDCPLQNGPDGTSGQTSVQTITSPFMPFIQTSVSAVTSPPTPSVRTFI